ncbi:MAG: glycosyltransferase [Acidimicrobiaceae bacterium]|nr:glycosyltransferase [Acidimicrobiaceae bacterium]
MDICTIIAKNYVAQARVLARSFAEHHPDGGCSVLVIDAYDGYLDPETEPFRILTPEQIGCHEFQEMALRYDVLELSTAVKPWLLAYLLDEGAAAITYLDPDIRVYSALSPLDDLAHTHGVVLIPHNTVPIPDDGLRPNQIDILLAGVYNLGYLSLGAGEETSTLLGWWRERLLNDCFVDPLNGYFVDQRWFDLAPGLVSDHVVVRAPQYNLAYWNLHGRRLVHDEPGYTVDGESLAFFHFSGFDPLTPDVLSRHQSRISVSPNTALQRLCDEYSDEALANGYRETKEWPYTYHLLPCGATFTPRLRKLYEIAVERGEVEGSPFTAEGDASFMSWLAQPAPGAPTGVNRLLADLYGTRGDLQAAFPDVADQDHDAFLRWAGEQGCVDEPALTLLPSIGVDPSEAVQADGAGSVGAVAVVARADPAVPVSGSDAQPASQPWGVNVVGYFRSELGTGEAARQVVSALDANNVPLLPVHGRTIPPNRQGHSFTHLDYTDARYPVNLICMNADVLGEFASQTGPDFFASRYSIGMWFWEVEHFPEVWSSAFDHVDELWLPTDHVVSAVSPVSSVPITKIILPVEMPPVLPVSRSELNLPEGFMYLFSFDHRSVFERKNPVAIIEAYTRAFDSGDGAVLVLKSINADSAREDHARLLAAADGRPDVHVVDGYLSSEQKNMMVAACDCYVSLHRAEGFGLTMAEAMYLGKPVVATGYSGNLDFMDEHNSYLVEHRLVPIGPRAAPYPPEGMWAEPDIDHASDLMREVFEHPTEASERARRGAERIRRTHSPQAAGEIMAARLDLLRGLHGERLARAARPAATAERLQHRVQAGPPTAGPSRLRRPGRLARRMLLRVIKPFSAYQKDVDAEIAQSLQSVEARIGELEATSTERHATLLAELRRDAADRPVWERIAGLTRSTIALESATAELQRKAGELTEIPQRLDDVTGSLRQIEWEGRAIPHMEDSPFEIMDHRQAGRIQGFRDDPGTPDADTYRTFEDTFRGSEDFIRDRQRTFLKLLDGRAPVLDLGCGRGEFLDLLAEATIPHLGVDSDAGMVRRCHQKGHSDVVQDDGLHYLETLEDGSLGAIFCAQVIEHLPYEAVLRLLRLARRKLDEGGILIAETVNPHSAAALKTFWVDPTHQHPIFPEVALTLCRSSGFSAAFIFHPNGTGDVERDRFTQGEYAVVAGGETLLRSDAIYRELRRDDEKARAPERKSTAQ